MLFLGYFILWYWIDRIVWCRNSLWRIKDICSTSLLCLILQRKRWKSHFNFLKLDILGWFHCYPIVHRRTFQLDTSFRLSSWILPSWSSEWLDSIYSRILLVLKWAYFVAFFLYRFSQDLFPRTCIALNWLN